METKEFKVIVPDGMEIDKELLLKDLCARLPYGVKGRVNAETTNGQYDINGDLIFFDTPFDVTLDEINISTKEIHVVAIGNEDTIDFIEDQQTLGNPYTIDEFKPYLRPMSSMTEEELKEFATFTSLSMHRFICNKTNTYHWYNTYEEEDWLNAHHFDYRGLIPKGLALEASKDMYDIK